MAARVRKNAKSDKENDPEVLMKRKFRAKCLFRALGRLVMVNSYWLMEAVDQYEGFDDVKRRVEQDVRSKAKKKQLLTITDKALLNKHAEERSEHEKKYIYKKIGGLKCFKRYPNHVKRKLAAVTYFKYYGPGRTIVRQHQEAHALYFIVTGDVIVSQTIFDELLQQYVSVNISVMHPGDMFGEVSLLHNIPRTATCTTTGHCELLTLMKPDFKNILQATVQEQWDEVRHAMSSFTYFDALDEVARREGCIMAKMKSYAINETILGDGVEVPNFVYFTLSGQCQMIETIQVISTYYLGRNSFALYDPFVPKGESEQDIDTKYFGAYKNLNRTSTSTESGEIYGKDSGSVPDTTNDGIIKNISSQRRSSGSKCESVPIIEDHKESKRRSTISQVVLFEKLPSEIILEPSEQTRDSISLNLTPVVEKPPENLRTFFMQVCKLNPGSSFGFGENMRDRRIVALTPVECLLLPRVWLLQRNTANIWTRIEHFLNKKIPTKKQLFKTFVEEQRWQEYREQLVSDVIARSNTVNWTSVHDVPYSIRMEEMLDI